MTNMFNQIPFSAKEFAENPEPRCPVVLLLDTSSSMSGLPITQLNDGIVTFKEALMKDTMASKRVEIAVVTFGPVRIISDFQTIDNFTPNELKASGNTPMGEAIETAIDMINQRKLLYRQNGIDYYRPWLFIISDGAPTDDWQKAAQLIHEGERSKSLLFFAVAVENADLDLLSQISVREVVKLKGLMFRQMFLWLSSSLSSVSKSNPGQPVKTPGGWEWVD